MSHILFMTIAISRLFFSGYISRTDRTRGWYKIALFAFFLLAHVGVEIAGAQTPAAQSKTEGKPLWQPYYISPRSGAQHIALEGEWQLGYRDAPIEQIGELSGHSKWIGAQVPSTVQMALYRAGELPHPYYNLNSEKYKWVDEKVWYYRKSFDLPQSARGSNIYLVFDGIDYFARVWLNGKLLGQHEGMFGGPVVNAAEEATYGALNEIVVEVRAGNYGNKKGFKPRESGTVIKPWVIAGGTGGEMFFPLGMWRGARVEIVPAIHIERPFLVTRKATDMEADLTLTLEVLADADSLKQQLHPWDNRQLDNRSSYKEHPLPTPRESQGALSVKFEIIEASTSQSFLTQEFPLKLNKGRNWIKQEIKVAKPKLWWPVGLGAPHLYKVRLSLMQQGKEIDRLREFDYGIRTIETKQSAGPQTADRWADWQFVVNGRPLFVKGVNWMPADILLDLPRERYRWLLEMARAGGIQMMRIWGGGIIETEEFYEACNDLGILVWEDFPVGNQDTPLYPQDVWEAQVVQTIFRLRNHPSLALYNGGNEFNPYSLGNAATLGILERSLAQFDPTRPFRRTSPDEGSIHTYPDMDPTWYAKLYNRVPYVAETGMHSIPEPNTIREVVAANELSTPLGNMYSEEFGKTRPDFRHHFVEYSPGRVPRMLSRASHIDDMRAPMLDSLAEATQIGAGEFYQVLSEGMQANYPVTTGLMPWVYKRPWPVVAIQLVDGFGQPTAPYYFLKRTYEPTHVLVKLPHLIWAPGEDVPVSVNVLHAPADSPQGLKASVTIFDDSFQQLWRQERDLAVKSGPSVTDFQLGRFTIPANYEDRFFLVVAELHQSDEKLISRSVYWPRSLKSMADKTFREKFREIPQPWPTLDKGPWLKRQVADDPTQLEVHLVANRKIGDTRSAIEVRVRNTGSKPALMTEINIEGVKRAFYATDNFFWMNPNEERMLNIDVLWREPENKASAVVTASAWNAAVKEIPLRP